MSTAATALSAPSPLYMLTYARRPSGLTVT
jgi:hypothetical protein